MRIKLINWKRWPGLLAITLLVSIPQIGLLASEVKKIVFIGDSITMGYGLEPEFAYPALIQAKIEARDLPYQVVNAGVSGDTTAGGLRRINWVLRGSQPEIVVIALGGNDGLRGVPVEQTRQNLRKMIDQVRELSPDSDIVLAGMRMPESMGADYSQRFFESFAQVAREKTVALIPFLLEGVGGEAAFNQDDQIHPNAAGQEKIAATVWEHLKPRLLLE
ncbi:MAG: arylesterase [Puniceicoccaceae bacterium]|nr:MAG: arylesterase [Puniceicoccaceae bacterium]